MQLWRTYYKDFLLGIALIILYLVTRLVLLTNLPIFTDEAIYIRWAQIGLHDASWRFISLTDGKQPLFIWLMYPYLKFIQDPLLAGRLVSVSTGLFTMLGLWLLTYELFKNKIVAWISIILYIAFPLALLHDRLAIYDSLVGTLYIFALYFSLRLIRKVNFATAYTLGLFLGAGVLNKSIGFISMGLLPFTLLLCNFKEKHAARTFYKLIALGLFSVIIGYGCYSILRLSPLFGVISLKNSTFVYPLPELFHQSTELIWLHFLGNFQGMFGWFTNYMTIFYLMFLILGLGNKQLLREKLLLVIYFLLPFLYLALFGKVLFPRFILFMCLAILPIVAYGITYTSQILHKNYKSITFPALIVFFTFITILQNSFVDYLIITDPLKAPVAKSDNLQYIGNWPAGWGIKEAINYLNQQAQSQKIFVGTQGTFGLMPFAFEMYMYNNPNITTKAYWPIEQKIPAELLQHAKQMPTYIYFYEPCGNAICPSLGTAPTNWPVKPIFTISKNNDQIHATLYQVLPQ